LDGPRRGAHRRRLEARDRRNVALFDGELSERGRMYAGKGGVQVDW
jgi:hypothetical protein